MNYISLRARGLLLCDNQLTEFLRRLYRVRGGLEILLELVEHVRNESIVQESVCTVDGALDFARGVDAARGHIPTRPIELDIEPLGQNNGGIALRVRNWHRPNGRNSRDEKTGDDDAHDDARHCPPMKGDRGLNI